MPSVCNQINRECDCDGRREEESKEKQRMNPSFSVHVSSCWIRVRVGWQAAVTSSIKHQKSLRRFKGVLRGSL